MEAGLLQVFTSAAARRAKLGKRHSRSVRMSPQNEDPHAFRQQPVPNLSWEEIMKARANETLQDWGWKHSPPENINAARRCRGCGRMPSDLAWTFYTDGPEPSAAGGGVQGWIVACPYCHQQVDFLPPRID
jgi:hypothetical protein